MFTIYPLRKQCVSKLSSWNKNVILFSNNLVLYYIISNQRDFTVVPNNPKNLMVFLFLLVITHMHVAGLLDSKLECLLAALHQQTVSAVLWQLLTAFHCESTQSCMGISITKHALLALNKLLHFTQVIPGYFPARLENVGTQWWVERAAVISRVTDFFSCSTTHYIPPSYHLQYYKIIISIFITIKYRWLCYCNCNYSPNKKYSTTSTTLENVQMCVAALQLTAESWVWSVLVFHWNFSSFFQFINLSNEH